MNIFNNLTSLRISSLVLIICVLWGGVFSLSKVSPVQLIALIIFGLLIVVFFWKSYLYIIILTILSILFQEVLNYSEFQFEIFNLSINLFGLINGINIILFFTYTFINRINWTKYPVANLYILFWFITSISVVFSIIFNQWFIQLGIRKWIAVANWVCVFLLILDSVNSDVDYKIVKTILIIGFLVLALSIVYSEVTGLVYVVENGIQRSAGFARFALVAGDLLSISILIVVSNIALSRLRINSIISFLLLIMFFVSLLFTNSRAPMVALLFALIMMFLQLSKINLKYYFFVPFILAGALAVIFLNKRFDLINIINNRSIDPNLYINLFGRIESWNYFINNIQLINIFFGKGIGSSQIEQFGMIHSPHNDYLRLFYELGIVGVIVNISIFMKILNISEKTYKLVLRQQIYPSYIREMSICTTSLIILLLLLKLNEDISYISSISNVSSIYFGMVVKGYLQMKRGNV